MKGKTRALLGLLLIGPVLIGIGVFTASTHSPGIGAWIASMGTLVIGVCVIGAVVEHGR